MSACAWAFAAAALLLLAALLCPVRYRLYISRAGGAAEARFFGGLYTKTVRWPEASAPEEPERLPDGAETAASAPVPVEKEMPLVPGRDGRPAADGALAGPGAARAAEERASEAADRAADTDGADTPETTEEPAADEEKRPGIPAVLAFAWDNGAVRILLRAAGRLYRHSRPRHLVLAGRAGLGDPMKTGVAAGLVYAALPGACRIAWDFTGAVFDVSAEARGRIVPLYVLYIIGGVLAAGPVRRTRAFLKGRPVSVSPRGAEEARNGRRREKETV